MNRTELSINDLLTGQYTHEDNLCGCQFCVPNALVFDAAELLERCLQFSPNILALEKVGNSRTFRTVIAEQYTGTKN
jgi:hypothetical protein